MLILNFNSLILNLKRDQKDIGEVNMQFLALIDEGLRQQTKYVQHKGI